MNIIAECAVNWVDLKEAKRMIDECKRLGLFAAKFQLYNIDTIKDLKGEVFNYCFDRMLEKEDAKELFDHGKSINQEVFFTPMFEDAVEWCEEIGVNYYKIRFNDNTNWSLQRAIVKTMKSTFISLGKVSYDYIMKESTFIPFLCIPKYPSLYSDYSGIDFKRFKGVSDHTSGTLLLETLQDEKYPCHYFEKHVRLRDGTLEDAWSITFNDLEAVL